jgi:hypothetical protein
MPKTKHEFSQTRFTPEFIKWDEEAFRSDLCVARGMTPTQRNMYRALCQAGMWCSTRPYLPVDDEQLSWLADAENLEHWLENKNAIMKKFSLVQQEDQQVWANKRMLAEWEYIMEVVEKNRERASKGGRARAEKTKQGDAERCEHTWPSNPSRKQICLLCGVDKSDLASAEPSSEQLDEELLEAAPRRDFEVEEIEED